MPEIAHGLRDFAASVSLSDAAVAELEFWHRQLSVWNGSVLSPAHFHKVLYTNASSAGWGAVLARVLQRTAEPAARHAASYWMDVETVASVFTELKGLWRSLVSFGADLFGCSVLHCTDNISTYCCIRKGGSRSARLNGITRLIWSWCMVHDIHLESQYVGKDVIIRAGADLMSRVDDCYDCRLKPDLFHNIWQSLGPVTFDRFACHNTVQRHPDTGRPLPYNSLLKFR